MDPSLLKERKKFLKQAASLPTIQQRPTNSQSAEKPKEKVKVSSTSANLTQNWKTSSGSSQLRFSVLTKIIRHMKSRHLDGDDYPLSLDEILDETCQTDVSNAIKFWLEREALPSNPKIIYLSETAKFVYKPTFLNLRDRRGLYRLLEQQHAKGLGGVSMEDVVESLPNAQRHVNALEKKGYITVVTRANDKKQVLFFNDKSMDLKIPEALAKFWNGVSVAETDDKKIEEYLARQGINCFSETVTPVTIVNKRKRGPGAAGSEAMKRRRANNRPLGRQDNEHMKDVLITDLDALKSNSKK